MEWLSDTICDFKKMLPLFFVLLFIFQNTAQIILF